jgi:hypothetical protein
MGCAVGQGFLFGPARPPEVYGPDPREMFRPARARGEPRRQPAPTATIDSNGVTLTT